MLKSILFSSVAIAALSLEPVFASGRGQLPENFTPEQRATSPVQGDALISQNQSSSLAGRKRTVIHISSKDHLENISTAAASSSTAASSSSTAASSSNAALVSGHIDHEDKRSCRGDDVEEAISSTVLAIQEDQGDAEEAISSTALGIQEDQDDVEEAIDVQRAVCIFEGEIAVQPFFQMLYDYLGRESYLALMSTSRRVRTAGSKIWMLNDPRRLHQIQWAEGIRVKTNMDAYSWTDPQSENNWQNYMDNLMLWSLQRDVFRLHQKIDGTVGNTIRHIHPYLQKLNKYDGRFKHLFTQIYLTYSTNIPLSLPSTPFIDKCVITQPGVNLAERGLALFVEKLAGWGVFTSWPGYIFPADCTQSTYYDAPSTPATRSVVERLENSKALIARLGNPEVPQGSDTHHERAKIYADLFREGFLFDSSALIGYTESLSRMDRHNLCSVCAQYGARSHKEDYIKAFSAFESEFDIDKWDADSISRIVTTLKNRVFGWSNISDLHMISRLCELMIKKSDDQPDIDFYEGAIDAYRALWDATKDERSLERAVELVDIAIARCGSVCFTDEDFCVAGASALKAMSGKTQRAEDIEKEINFSYSFWKTDREIYGDEASYYNFEIHPDELFLSGSLFQLWSADQTKTHYLERADEVLDYTYREYLSKTRGDASLNDEAGFFSTYWLNDQPQMRYLQKRAETFEMMTIVDGGFIDEYGHAARAYRALWQADPSQTHHFLKAFGFFEQRYNLLKRVNRMGDRMDVFVHAWYSVQYSRIDPAQTHRREEAKALWQQALQMGLSREEMDSDYHTLFDTLSSEFDEGNAELESEGRGVQA